jgi:peroxiredoxin (alkyl hydroperoxide reductase subunit C)
MSGKEDMDCKDWYFCTKKLAKEDVLSKVVKN